MTHLVTGGAGFIGSHLVDALCEQGTVRVIDDLSTGSAQWVDRRAQLCVGDAADPMLWDRSARDVQTLWHVAADPDVRRGAAHPVAHADRHLRPTLAALEAMRAYDIDHMVFTSTSTVYGDADVRPTPEDHGPLCPISIYGGAKLACEALISAWCGTYGLRAQAFRFANVVGPRSNHGVTYDFVHKLRADPARLEILGDGTQTKSYVHVSDTVSGMLHAAKHAGAGFTVWNIGSLDAIPVTRIAQIVAEEMGLEPEHAFTGGTAAGAGWAGDVKHMGLDVGRLRQLGWEPSHGSEEAIRDAARAILSATGPMAS